METSAVAEYSFSEDMMSLFYRQRHFFTRDYSVRLYRYTNTKTSSTWKTKPYDPTVYGIALLDM